MVKVAGGRVVVRKCVEEACCVQAGEGGGEFEVGSVGA